MPYVAICHDREPEGALTLRNSVLAAHLDYVASIADRVLVAGPMSIEGSSDFNASLFIYAVDKEADAWQLLQDDPYYQAGIYGNVTVAPFTPARGSWL